MQIDPLAMVSVVVPATAALSVFVGYLGGRSVGRVQGLRKAVGIMGGCHSLLTAKAFVQSEILNEGGDL